MKKADFEKLEKYETALFTAKRSNFARLTATDFNEICEVYKEMYGVEVTRSQRNCNACKIRVLTRLADEYFKYKERKEKKNEERG